MIEKTIVVLGRLPINISSIHPGLEEFLPRDFRIQIFDSLVSRIDLDDNILEKGLFLLLLSFSSLGQRVAR